MSAEACPDCGRPFASTLDEYRGGRFCGRELSRFDCNDTDHLERNCFAFALEHMRARLAASEFENAAWRALAVDGDDGDTLMFRRPMNGRAWRCQCVGSKETGEGDTPQAAAISLATKLGLIGGKT